MIRRLLFPFAAAATLCAAASASAETVHDEQIWANFTAMGALRGNIVYFAEAQPRWGDGAGRLDTVILRPAVGVKLSPNMTLYQGYARVVTPRNNRTDLKEDRSFQQLTWVMGKPWGGEFSTRTRLEQRWRSDGDDLGWRARGMARLEVPIEPGSKIAALGYSEVFMAFNDTDWGARSGFDQLRTFVGAEIGVGGGKSTVEAGYLNQFVNQPAGRSRMNHVLSLTFFLRH